MASIDLRPLSLNDLELVLAWRSNPLVYRYFRGQDEPLDWETHLEWFSGRSRSREDFIIEYQGRRVGVISIDDNMITTVYIGEIKSQKKGIASTALRQACNEVKYETFRAEVHRDNSSSISLFESCGFEQIDVNGEWYIFEK